MRSVGILVAMQEELQPLRKHWRLDWTGPGYFFCGKWAGLRLQVALSGVGPARARHATQQLLRYGQPDMLLSCGFSGGLRSDLKVGDSLLASSVETTARAPVSTHPFSQAEERDRRVGPILCVDRLVPTAVGKQQLGLSHPQALAVDMESIAVTETPLPWRALRVIIDTCDENLPLDFSRCMSAQGQTHHGRLAWELMRNPQALPGLIRFGAQSARATRSLVEACSTYLEVLSNC